MMRIKRLSKILFDCNLKQFTKESRELYKCTYQEELDNCTTYGII